MKMLLIKFKQNCNTKEESDFFFRVEEEGWREGQPNL